MDDADRAMRAFLDDCEGKSAPELDHYMRTTRLSPTWKIGATRILDRKRMEEDVDRLRETADLARRQTLAAESQARTAESANRKSTVALVISIIAIGIAGLAALPDLVEFFKRGF